MRWTRSSSTPSAHTSTKSGTVPEWAPPDLQRHPPSDPGSPDSAAGLTCAIAESVASRAVRSGRRCSRTRWSARRRSRPTSRGSSPPPTLRLASSSASRAAGISHKSSSSSTNGMPVASEARSMSDGVGRAREGRVASRSDWTYPGSRPKAPLNWRMESPERSSTSRRRARKASSTICAARSSPNFAISCPLKCGCLARHSDVV